MTQTIPLSDAIILQRGFDLPTSQRRPGQYPVVTSTGMATTHDEFKVQGPGVVIGRSGSIGGGQYIESDFWPLNTTLWVKDFKGNNERFVYYLLKSLDFSSFNAGAAVPTLNRNHLSALRVTIPGRSTQDKIADILGTIDEKIELNRQMNETLEQMGQALFRHHFVDNLETGRLTVGDVAQVIDCLHSKKPERVDRDTGNILLQLNNIKDDGTLDLSDKYYISDEDYSKWTSRIEASENDFVITNVGRSGAVSKIPEGVKAALGRNMTGIRLMPKTNFPGFMSFLLNSAYMKKQIESKLDHGTILSALNVKNIPKLLLPTSNEGLIFEHEAEFSNIRSKIEANVNEIQTLTTLRDTLLPRLINGRVKI